MRKKKAKAALFIYIIVLTATTINNVHSQPLDSTVFVDPPSIIDEENTGSGEFTININISFVILLNHWDLKLRYNPALLYTNKSLIEEGSFLKQDGAQTVFSSYLTLDYIQLGCLIPARDWVDGSGTLARVTFEVKGRGESTLDLYEIQLADADGNSIYSESEDGYFRNIEETSVPQARFVYSAQAYNVTFNASSCFSVGNTIHSYIWFWGGSAYDSVKTSNTTNPITWHKYPEKDPPEEDSATVRLVVTDQSNITSNVLVKTITFGVPVHDVELTSLEASPRSVLVGNYSTVTIAATVANNGNQYENTNVTISRNATFFDFQNVNACQWVTMYSELVSDLSGFENRTGIFAWSTNGFSVGYYAIKAEASLVQDDRDLSNNLLTSSVRIVTVTFAPIADFSYLPSSPKIGEEVFFDASQSYDQDGRIVSYRWDFGDSSQVTTTVPSVEHAYQQAETFNIVLTVTDDDEIAGNAANSIRVSKLQRTLSLSLSSSKIAVDSQIVVTGVVPSLESGANVTILYRISGPHMWETLGMTLSDSGGAFFFSWTPSAPGVYELRASWDGDERYVPVLSDVQTVTAKFTSNVSISLDRSSVSTGESVKVSGLVAHSSFGSVVEIEYRLNNISWTLLVRTVTDGNGRYAFNWRPIVPGVYELRTHWKGNGLAEGAESVASSLTVVEGSIDFGDYIVYLVLATGVVFTILAGWLMSRSRRDR